MAAAQQIDRVPEFDALVARVVPGAVIENVQALGVDDSATGDASTKGIGYGVPLLISLRESSGHRRQLVFHTAKPDDFGHDRHSDRAGNMLLAYDTFGAIPKHVAALDVGAISAGGSVQSLRGSEEFYILTEYAQGRIYADDLRGIAESGKANERDRARCDRLADYLASLHSMKYDCPATYRRSVRDLVGAGEGVFGMTDGYPADAPAAPPQRLRDIEQRCAEWRWRLRGRESRLSRIHGDFHPFNILFGENDSLSLLDASRGCQGDPADDVTCLAINYIFASSAESVGKLRLTWLTKCLI